MDVQQIIQGSLITIATYHKVLNIAYVGVLYGYTLFK